MRKEKPLIEWFSANIFKNVEAERIAFIDMEGRLSAEENLRIEALGVRAKWENQSEVDLWLESDRHVESLSDLPKIMQDRIFEERMAACDSLY